MCGTEAVIDLDSDDQRKSPLEPTAKSTKKPKSDRKKRAEDDVIKKEPQPSSLSMGPSLTEPKKQSKMPVIEPLRDQDLIAASKEPFNEVISSSQELIVSSPLPEELQITSPVTTPNSHFQAEALTQSEMEKSTSMDLDHKREMEVQNNDQSAPVQTPCDLELKVQTLTRHSKGVFSVAFNQSTPSLLASAYVFLCFIFLVLQMALPLFGRSMTRPMVCLTIHLFPHLPRLLLFLSMLAKMDLQLMPQLSNGV